MKKIFIFIAAFFISSTGIPFTANANANANANEIISTRPEVAEKISAYESADDIIVWTLRYGKIEDHKVLIQIVNVDHPWNRKIHLMSVEDTGSRRYIYTYISGKRFNVLIFDRRGNAELSIPSISQSIPVYYSRNYTSEGNAQAFLSDYLNSN